MNKKPMGQEHQHPNDQTHQYKSKSAQERTFPFHLAGFPSAREWVKPKVIIKAAKACATRV